MPAADGGGTEVELASSTTRSNAAKSELQQRGKRMKLTIGHWYGVLQLRAANRHVIDMFVGQSQIVEGLEFLGGLGERPDVDKREFAGGQVSFVDCDLLTSSFGWMYV